MHWAQALDTSLFHLVNPRLSSGWLDVLMPFVSGNAFFIPVILVLAIALFVRGGARGRILVFMLLLVLAFGDGVVCNMLKHALHRPRPFWTLADAHVPAGIGKTDSGSMPSSHTANWFAATMVALIYYRRSVRFMLPLACLVGFSRIYNGVHYPSDVVVGAILGAGYAAALVWTMDALWRAIGQRWFPLWWERMPSLFDPVVRPAKPEVVAKPSLLDGHWMRLAYVLIFTLLAVNLIYNASGIISLSPDEAYQWIWSKHLALSYYSKPLLIALTQWAGTHLWGDTVFGVRFFAPVITALTSVIILHFIKRVANVRAAFWLSIILPATPLICVGSILMTIDPLSVMFWMLAVIAGWRAVQDDSTTRDWIWVGLWMGLGFLSKYTALFQLLSWVLFFALYAPARKQLRRVGPYLALLINLLCTTPVLVWNSQNHWVTVKHVSQDGHFDQAWSPTIGNLWAGFRKYTLDFVFTELGLQNPFFFIPVLCAIFLFWRLKPHPTLLVYLFSMGAPIFLVYFLLTFHSRALPNWIAPSVLPFFCLGVIYWESRWNNRPALLKMCLVSGLIFGFAGSVILRDTHIMAKIVPLPSVASTFRAVGWTEAADKLDKAIAKIVDLDSTHRVKGWTESAEVIEDARRKLEAEGKPTFIVCNHYGIVGEMTFNIPAAKATVRDNPFIYFMASDVPQNQFYFWPNYLNRKGQNAIFVIEMALTEKNMQTVQTNIAAEFESTTNLGLVVSTHQGLPAHCFQIFECRNLR